VVAKILEVKNAAPQAFYSAQEQQEYEILSSEKRQVERGVTLFLLHDFLGVKSALHHHANGSPYLHNSKAHISISHSQHEVGITLHPTRRVGIDIESTQRNFTRIATRFLSETEQNYFPAQVQQCLAWCAKEVIFKIANEQGVDFATQIALEKFDEKSEGEIFAHFVGKEKKQNYALRYHVINNTAIIYSIA